MPGMNDIYTLRHGLLAFMARAALLEKAQKTVDIQYYIWRRDLSGMSMMRLVLATAQRGVKVRLLIDDNNSKQIIPHLNYLALHPLIEVKIFNPGSWRKWRWLNYITDFSMANRRMHNKSLIMDNQAAVVGGRNIGDEYFEASEGTSFVDLDVVVKGKTVEEMTSSFQIYWDSEWAKPLAVVDPVNGETATRVWEKDTALLLHSQRAQQYQEMILEALDFFLKEKPISGIVHFLADPPEKMETQRRSTFGILSEIMRQFGEAKKQLFLVSPYFVPGKRGTEQIAALARKGVRVAVLTNSLSATDVPAVHAGYRKRRKTLLRAGVEIFEIMSLSDYPKKFSFRKTFKVSSQASLHAKTFSIDDQKVFVGSFNLDPRSMAINTEMGVVIESEELAQQMHAAFMEHIPENSYRVFLDGRGKVCWRSLESGQEKIWTKEPESTFSQRVIVAVISRLPVEWLL